MSEQDKTNTTGADESGDQHNHGATEGGANERPRMTIGGRELTDAEQQLVQIGMNTALRSLDGQRLSVELQKNANEAEVAGLTATKLSFELQQMQRREMAEARVHKAPLRVPFNGEVNELSMAQIQQGLMMASDMFPARPIEIILNTQGGSIVDGMMMYNYLGMLRSAPRNHHVTVIALGQAASMGGILLQSADWRVIGPDARILIHMPAGGVMGTLEQIEAQGVLMRQMWDQLAERLAARSKMSAKEIQQKVHEVKDWWLTAQEALELGFVDQILTVPNPNKSTPPPTPEPEPTDDAGKGAAAAAMSGMPGMFFAPGGEGMEGGFDLSALGLPGADQAGH